MNMNALFGSVIGGAIILGGGALLNKYRNDRKRQTDWGSKAMRAIVDPNDPKEVQVQQVTDVMEVLDKGHYPPIGGVVTAPAEDTSDVTP